MPTPPDNKVKSYSHFAAHCSVTAKAQDKFTRHQNVERYRRLLKTATDEERRNYLGRLIVEEQQKQNDADIDRFALAPLEPCAIRQRALSVRFGPLVPLRYPGKLYGL